MRWESRKPEIRAAIVAAIVALVVAAPLSEAAHDGVSSAAKTLKGKRGPRGKQGPTGPQGPTGATGFATFTQAKGIGRIAAGETGFAVATCPDGARAVSAGYDLGNHDTEDVHVIANLVGDGGKSGAVMAEYSGTGAATIHAIVVCVAR